jgi:transcriptional regulator with AAA-type ATPase domain
MRRLDRNGVIILGLLAVTVSYVILFSLSDIRQTGIIGFRGDLQEEQFRVSQVWQGSPADIAGMQAGDIITAADGRSTAEWYRLFRSDRGAYLKQRHRLRNSEIAYRVTRDQQPLIVRLQTRQLSAAEIGTHYGVKIGLVVFLASLAILISLSNTRKQDAFLVSLCLCFAIPWLASLEPYSHLFFSPLFRGVNFPLLHFIKLLETFSLPLVMSTLVHITLVFPEPRPVLSRHRWLLLPLYLLPPLVLLLAMVLAEGDLLNRIAFIYLARVWLITVLLILATLLILYSFRYCDSHVQRERTRWIVVAMVIVAVSHLLCWNLPILFFGSPLIANYDWLLVPLALIPLSMTASITNHELFGIRGIVRGRIKLLETLLEREQHMVINRDQRIRELTQEIDQLQSELKDYTLSEQASFHDQDQLPSLNRLEARYPALAQIRRERLISASPLWEKVFEQVVLATQGPAPVIILGESGTGKSDLAWTIHQLSDRKQAVYKAISCAQFEHADPAFALGRLFGIGSGHGLPNVPKEGHRGLLEQCDGGTLFLDDVDRLPLNAQDLLLYPLEGKAFEPGIGSGPSRTVSVKFIFATNRDTGQLVADGSFRADVLSRIGSRIRIPPLRERPEDIPLLIEHFTRQISAELKHEIRVVSPRTLNLLGRYPFRQGNARELRLEIQKAIGKAMLEDDNVLRAGYLSENLRRVAAGGRDDVETESGPTAPGNAAVGSEAGTAAVTAELGALRKYRFQIKPAEEELGLSHKSRTLSNHLRGICIRSLSENHWDLQRAARSLAESADVAVIAKLEGKMRRYLENIRHNVSAGTEKKLFNNLPVAYHESLEMAIAWARRKN